MSIKDEKTQLIKQIVGEKLKDYGFTYLKTDGPCRIFIREVRGIKRFYDPENQVVKQYVTIQESSFSQSLIVRFHTDAFAEEYHIKTISERPEDIDEWLFPAHFEALEVVGKYLFPKFMPLNIVVNVWKYMVRY